MKQIFQSMEWSELCWDLSWKKIELEEIRQVLEKASVLKDKTDVELCANEIQGAK